MDPTRIVKFMPEHLPAVKRFAQTLWPWPENEAFYRWRFLDCEAFHHAYIALRGDECLAMICAFERQLLVDGQRRTVLDCFDWASLPEHQDASLGLFVLLALMKKHPLPVLGFAGTNQSLALRDKLGWRRQGLAQRYMMPLAVTVDKVKYLPRPLTRIVTGLAASLWFRPRRRAVPRNGRIISVSGVGPEIENLYTGDVGYATVLLPDRRYLRWLLHGYESVGHYLPLYFTLGGELRGWTLARIYYYNGDCKASLVECFAPRPSADLYTWMVSETLVRLASFGAQRIYAASSCQALNTALGRNRFLKRELLAVDYKPRGDSLPAAPINLGYNAADCAFRPSPKWAWAVPRGPSL